MGDDVSRTVYRRAGLAQIHELGMAERWPFLPASVLVVPPLAFGETDFSHPEIFETMPQGPQEKVLWHPPVQAYMLDNAVVQGEYGVVLCADLVVAESTPHLPLHRIEGAKWLSETDLLLPDQPVVRTLPTAYHLLNCNRDNYFHWLLEGISRFNAAELWGVSGPREAGGDFPLLLPPLELTWKRVSLSLLVPSDLRYVTLPDRVTARVGRLLYIPEFCGGGMVPHRGLLPVFDRMRAAAYAALRASPTVPWRRLFISRADSANRVLVNEIEVAACAARAGFERVVLEDFGVADQIRLFAEATHILAPHGAGLTNLLFCRPGTAVCELHMDCYVQWAYRRLAALRGLRYGCVIGTHIRPRHPWPHRNTWRIDPEAVAAVLADPRFSGG